MPLWRLEPNGDLIWPLHKGQIEVLEATERFVLMLAGFQVGKTVFIPCWLDEKIAQMGPGDYLAASATHDLMQLKLLPELIAYFRGCLGWEYRAGDRVLETADKKTRIILRSGHQPASLESATAKAAALDEWGQDGVPVESWEAVQRRLAISQGYALITTTPYSMGWLYQQVYKRAMGGDRDYRVISFSSLMNPTFPRAEYERMKRTLPDWKFQMFCRGRFTRPAGLIYGDYEDSYRDQGGHLVRPFAIPPHWLRYVGIDFGATLHNAQLWLAEDPENHDLFGYREVTGIDKTGPEQAREAAAYNEPVKMALGGAKSEDEKRLEWSEAGFDVLEPFIADVETGIDRVTGLFKQRRLFIFDTLTGTRSDLGTYSRELDDAGEVLQKIKDKDKWHRMDALRYVSSAFPLDRPEPLPPPKDALPPRARVADEDDDEDDTPWSYKVDDYYG